MKKQHNVAVTMAIVAAVLAVVFVLGFVLRHKADRALGEAKQELAEELKSQPNDIVVYRTNSGEYRYRSGHVSRSRVGLVKPDRQDRVVDSQKVRTLIDRSIFYYGCIRMWIVLEVVVFIVALAVWLKSCSIDGFR